MATRIHPDLARERGARPRPVAAAIDAARVLRRNHELDAVGAGDAFTAVVVAGLGTSRPPEAILPQAARFAAAVCAIRGATDRDPEFYDDVRRFVTPDRAVPREASPQGGSRG